MKTNADSRDINSCVTLDMGDLTLSHYSRKGNTTKFSFVDMYWIEFYPNRIKTVGKYRHSRPNVTTSALEKSGVLHTLSVCL